MFSMFSHQYALTTAQFLICFLAADSVVLTVRRSVPWICLCVGHSLSYIYRNNSSTWSNSTMAWKISCHLFQWGMDVDYHLFLFFFPDDLENVDLMPYYNSWRMLLVWDLLWKNCFLPLLSQVCFFRVYHVEVMKMPYERSK